MSKKTTLGELARKKILEKTAQQSPDGKPLSEAPVIQTIATLNGPQGEIDPDAPAANIEPTPVATPATSDANKATIAPKPSAAVPTITYPDKSLFTIRTEEIRKIFGNDLSEDFITKASALFETAVNAKIEEFHASLQEEYATAIAEFTSNLTEELVSGLNEYVQYCADEFIKENKLAVDTGIKTELVDNFLAGMKKLFDESYVKMPEGKTDVLDELMKANQALQEEINNLLAANSDLTSQITESQCRIAFEDEAAGLSTTAKDRLATLAENVSFGSVDEFRTKVRFLREQITPGPVTAKKAASTPSQPTMLAEDYDGEDMTPEANEPDVGSDIARKVAQYL